MFRKQNTFSLRREVVSTSPNHQVGVPTLVGCPRLLIQYIRSYPPYWTPFLHPQPAVVTGTHIPTPVFTAYLILSFKTVTACHKHLKMARLRAGRPKNKVLSAQKQTLSIFSRNI
jgi:hypothetical protein